MRNKQSFAWAVASGVLACWLGLSSLAQAEDDSILLAKQGARPQGVAQANPTVSLELSWPIDEPLAVGQAYACKECLDPTKVSQRYLSGVNVHTGSDLRPASATCDAYGVPVKAAGAGYVLKKVAAGPDSHGLGNTVIVDHENGLYTLYAHLDRARVERGERVTRGQRIGEMGNSTTKPRDESVCTHVHFEVKVRGVLGDRADDCQYWGYTPRHPAEFGYWDPALLIRRSQDVLPLPYVEQNACPGEGCSYGEWLSLAETRLFAVAGETSKSVATVRPYELVRALGGAVWTLLPGEVAVMKDYERFRQGERVQVMSYHGEGIFTVRHRGEVLRTTILTPDNCAESSPFCWGRWQWQPVHAWWVQIRTASGKTGWTAASGQFAGHHSQYEEPVIRAIVRCVQRRGSVAECAQPVQQLVAGLKSAVAKERDENTRRLLDVGALGGGAVPDLAQMLRDPRANVRGLAAAVLGQIGRPAASAATRLVELGNGDADEHVRREACDAVYRIRESAR